MKLMSCLLAIAGALTLGGTASAADRDVDRFTTQVQSLGGWYGVEVDHIAIVDGQVRASGINRQGSRVMLVRDCGKSGIACPANLLARAARGTTNLAENPLSTGGVATSSE